MHRTVDRTSIASLVDLLNIRKKGDAVRYTRDLVISSDALVGIILAAQVGSLGPYGYTSHAREISSPALEPSTAELNAFARAGVGKATGLALKAIRKLDQQFVERSLLVAHLFYSSSHHYWHLFYFGQRDYTARRNHWKHGPHLHYSQNAFTREPLPEIWAKVCAPSPVFPPSLHIRFDYHHNRSRAA